MAMVRLIFNAKERFSVRIQQGDVENIRMVFNCLNVLRSYYVIDSCEVAL